MSTSRLPGEPFQEWRARQYGNLMRCLIAFAIALALAGAAMTTMSEWLFYAALIAGLWSMIELLVPEFLHLHAERRAHRHQYHLHWSEVLGPGTGREPEAMDYETAIRAQRWARMLHADREWWLERIEEPGPEHERQSGGASVPASQAEAPRRLASRRSPAWDKGSARFYHRPI